MNTKRTLVAAAAIAVMVASLISVINRFRPAPLPDPLSRGIGEAAARAAARVLGGSGRVVLITHDPRETSVPLREAQAFTRALNAFPGMTLLGVEHVSVGKAMYDDEPDADGASGREAAEILRELPQRHGEVDLVVSLVRPQWLGPGHLRSRGAPSPGFILMADSPNDRLRRLMQQGPVKAAIIWRAGEQPSPDASPRTPQEWFDHFYEIHYP